MSSELNGNQIFMARIKREKIQWKLTKVVEDKDGVWYYYHGMLFTPDIRHLVRSGVQFFISSGYHEETCFEIYVYNDLYKEGDIRV